MIRHVLVVAGVAVALAATAGPAHADDGVELSVDGTVWTDHLREPLFAPGFRWVPGDVESSSFYVRNQGPTGAEMTVAVVSSDPGALLARRDLALAARVPGGDWIPLLNGEPSRQLGSEVVARGARTRVDLRVAFRAGARNGSQGGRLPLSARVTLTEAGTRPPTQGPPSTWLPNTGTTISQWLVWLAAALIGSGLALLAAGRRREEQPQEVSVDG